MKKGFTLIELLIVVAIIAILAAIAVPNFLEAQTRSKVSRVRADHRTIATGVETYFIDNNQYPAHHGCDYTPGDSSNVLAAGSAFATSTDSRTFALRGGSQMNTMTTPISYLSSIPADPFADARGLPFRYLATASTFIVGSFGPDADQGITTGNGGVEGDGDLEWAFCSGALVQGVETIFNTYPGGGGAGGAVSAETIDIRTALIVGTGTGGTAWTYDPTNGTISEGDVWRIKD